MMQNYKAEFNESEMVFGDRLGTVPG